MTIKWPKSPLAKKRLKMPEGPELLKGPDWQKRPEGGKMARFAKKEQNG